MRRWSCSLLALLFVACAAEEQPLIRNFYHWETELRLDSTERDLLTGHDRLYVKAFDLVRAAGQAVPTAEIQLVDTVGLPRLVPVVFITNEVILQLASDQIPTLADQIATLTEELLPANFPELQLDCDWTARTQVQYFELLKAVRERLRGTLVSCTIRLHQYRDRQAQGIPPVERGVLMAYNTGDIEDWATDNSIIDTNALRNYLADQPPYPMPLDIAVAVYDWAAVYRRGELVQLINEPDTLRMRDTSYFTLLPSTIPGTRVRAKKSTYFNGISLYRDDELRYEAARPERVDREAQSIRNYVGHFPGQRLIIYRLGSRLWHD